MEIKILQKEWVRDNNMPIQNTKMSAKERRIFRYTLSDAWKDMISHLGRLMKFMKNWQGGEKQYGVDLMVLAVLIVKLSYPGSNLSEPG